jgi:hypothetical protein
MEQKPPTDTIESAHRDQLTDLPSPRCSCIARTAGTVRSALLFIPTVTSIISVACSV